MLKIRKAEWLTIREFFYLYNAQTEGVILSSDFIFLHLSPPNLRLH